MTIEEIEKRVKALEDLEDLKKLHREYMDLMDNLQYDRVPDLFTEDATVKITIQQYLLLLYPHKKI